MDQKQIEKELEETKNNEDKKSNSTKEEKITINKKDFEALLERVTKLEDESGVLALPEQSKNRTVIVRFIDDKLVINYGNVAEKKELNGSTTSLLEVITEDNKKHVVEYLKFMNEGKKEKAEILNIEKKFFKKKTGIFVEEVEYKADNFEQIATGDEVELENVIPAFIYTIKLSDGREVEMSDIALN